MATAITLGVLVAGSWCRRRAAAPETLVRPSMLRAPPSKVTSYGHWVLLVSGEGELRTVTSSPGSRSVFAVSVVVCARHSRQCADV
eukprot:6715330-Pyramimonas_sp.AAC.1